MKGILASIACGIIGSQVVTRRITYIAGGIAHSVLAGMGSARYYQTVYQWDWLHPFYGAVAAAIIAAIIIGLVSIRAKQREDTIIGAVWAIGMADGNRKAALRGQPLDSQEESLRPLTNPKRGLRHPSFHGSRSKINHETLPGILIL